MSTRDQIGVRLHSHPSATTADHPRCDSRVLDGARSVLLQPSEAFQTVLVPIPLPYPFLYLLQSHHQDPFFHHVLLYVA